MTSLREKLLVLYLAVAGVGPAAQTQAPPARATGTVQSETAAILVDVVVRD